MEFLVPVSGEILLLEAFWKQVKKRVLSWVLDRYSDVGCLLILRRRESSCQRAFVLEQLVEMLDEPF